MLAAASAEEDVVVGAAKREQSLGNVASAVTVITADRIRRFGYRTIAEALSGVAGAHHQDNRLTSQIGIRGLQVPGGFNSRILVLVDGVTINEAWGAFAGVGFDSLVSIDDIARIEVIRGPVGAVYGTNAFFAIINIVTRGAAEGARAWGRAGLHSIQGGIATAGFAMGDVHQQLRGTVLAMGRFGEDNLVPAISPEPLRGDGGNTFVAALSGQYKGSFGQLRAYRSRRDSPFAPYDSDPAIVPPYTLDNYQLLAEGGHTRELSPRTTLVARAYGIAYRFFNRIRNAADDHFLDYGDALTIGAEVRARHELVPKKLGVTAGAEANVSRTESRSAPEGVAADAIPLDINIDSAYAELDGQVTPWLGFVAGLRFDQRVLKDDSGEGWRIADQKLSPRAALFVARPERYGAKLLYAEGFRYPSAFESYFADGVDFSSNPNVASESVRSYEVVAWAKPLPGLSTRVSAWHWKARDVIEQRPDPADSTLLQFQNVGQYVTYGVEGEASYRNVAGWYGYGGVAVARVGSAASASEPVRFGDVVDAPVVTATGGVSTPRLGGFAHVSTEAQVVGRRPVRPAEDGSPFADVPTYVGWNATVYVPSVRRFDISVGVRNILGRKQRIPAPGDYDRFGDGVNDPVITVPVIPGEGREVFAKVGYTY